MCCLSTTNEIISAQICSVVNFHIKNASDRQDILLTIWMKIYENLDSYEETGHLLSYVYRIAYNSCMDFYRSKEKLKARTEEYCYYTRVTQTSGLDILLIEREILANFIDSLKKCPSCDTDTLILKHFFLKRLSIAGIAKRMNISRRRVNKVVTQQKVKLQNQRNQILNGCIDIDSLMHPK